MDIEENKHLSPLKNSKIKKIAENGIISKPKSIGKSTKVGPTNANSSVNSKQLETKNITGGTLSYQPLQFRHDSEWFYLMKSQSVGVYHVETGMLIRHLNFPVKSGRSKKQKQNQENELEKNKVEPAIFSDRTKLIAAIPESQEESANVYGVCDNGSFVLWDASTGEVQRTWAAGISIQQAVMDPNESSVFYVASQRKSQDKSKVHMVYKVTLGKKSNSVTLVQILKMSNTCLGIAVSTDSRWIATFSRFKLYLIEFQESGQRVHHKWDFTERLSTVSFHPTQPLVAVGDWRGRINFMYCLVSLDKNTINHNVSKRALHWHARKVNSVAFTEDGNFMLSGGQEGVLVIWQLGTENRTFISRLGADIVGVTASQDQLYYAVTLSDNTVRVYSALNLKLVSITQGLQLAGHIIASKLAAHTSAKLETPKVKGLLRQILASNSTNVIGISGISEARGFTAKQYNEAIQIVMPKRFTTNLVVNPVTNHLTLNGESGLLQVYNPISDRSVSTIEVAAFNKVSGSTPEHGAKVPHVNLVAYSNDGQWMATVDSRMDQGFETDSSKELYLKFWHWSPKLQRYELNTRIDNPHPSKIFGIAFQPSRSSNGKPLCVTTGDDGNFRVWQLQRPREGQKRSLLYWTTHSAGYYRGITPTGVAFSKDGSALAVTFGHSILIWDPVLNQPRITLTSTLSTDSLVGLAFVGQTHIVSWSSSHIDVWNLLNASVEWSLPIPVLQVYTDPRWDVFTIASNLKPLNPKSSTILVFSPSSSTPLAVNVFSEPILSVACIPAPTQSGDLGQDQDSDTDEPLSLDPSASANPLNKCMWVTLTSKGQFYLLGSKSTSLTMSKSAAAVQDVSQEYAKAMDSTQFASLFGSSQSQGSFGPTSGLSIPDVAPPISHEAQSALRFIRPTLQSTYASAPSHIIPPVASLFQQLVSNGLPKSESLPSEAGPNTNRTDSIDQDSMDIEDDSNSTSLEPTQLRYDSTDSPQRDNIDKDVINTLVSFFAKLE
ncbi:NET1-associated nuclear protein 1 [Mycoemilia scoparia]|uniref:NET1-associated nuclear protein 1 n=1 Tax=Mycoemilia scoparia TaxID=417184 RepID=A0A9W8ABV6_9FUNG|nr:NET1-associated nuclear protein 1 [Mycoemilia scoparia]